MNAIQARRSANAERKNIVKISFVDDDISNLAIPKSFGSDTRSLAKAIQKIQAGSSLLETIINTVNIQSDILIRMRQLASKSASEVIDNNEKKTIGSYFLAVEEELSRTQSLLLRSVKTLRITVENLSAADSTISKKNFTEKIAMLTKKRLRPITPIGNKE